MYGICMKIYIVRTFYTVPFLPPVVVRCGQGVMYLTSPGRPTDSLILAYSWAWLVILVAGKGRGVMFLFLLFL